MASRTEGKRISSKEAFSAVKKHCLAKPGATQDEPWPGDTVWKVGGKMFCIWSGHDSAVSVKSSLEKQAALVQHPAITVASYVGRYGWVTVAAQDRETFELALPLSGRELRHGERQTPTAR